MDASELNSFKILTISNMVKNVHIVANDSISDKTMSDYCENQSFALNTLLCYNFICNH